MYKKIFISLLALLATLGIFLNVANVYAADFEEGANITISEEKEENQFLTGSSITVDQKINGDLYIAGDMITVNGDVTGNIFIAGGDVTIYGNVSKSVYIASGNVTIENAVIERDLYIAGGNVKIESSIGEDVKISSGQISIKGSAEDVYIAGGMVTLEANVAGDIMVAAGNLKLTDSVVNGDAYLTAESLDLSNSSFLKDLKVTQENVSYELQDDVIVGGEFSNVKAKMQNRSDFDVPFESDFITAPLGFGFALISKFVSLISAILLGLLVLYLMPVKVREASIKLDEVRDFAHSFAIGFFGHIVMAIIAIALLISVVGWKVLFLLGSLALVLMIISLPIISFTLGEQLLKRFGRKVTPKSAMIVGIIFVSLLDLIPLFGDIIVAILATAAFGALISTKFEKMKKQAPITSTAKVTEVKEVKEVKKVVKVENKATQPKKAVVKKKTSKKSKK